MTPKGTPSLRILGYSQSGSWRDLARSARRSRWNGCPDLWWNSMRPVSPVVLVRGRWRRGEWIEEVKSSTQGSQISANSLHSIPQQGERFLSGGGRRPCDGFPAPSLIGLIRNPNWTRIGLSSNVILGECVCVVGLSVLLVGGVEGFAPWAASDSRMARANPFIMFQGYRLRSEDVVPTGFVCDGWLHRNCSQRRRSKLVAKVVGFGVHCPNLHWSKLMWLSPSACVPCAWTISSRHSRGKVYFLKHLLHWA